MMIEVMTVVISAIADEQGSDTSPRHPRGTPGLQGGVGWPLLGYSWAEIE